MSPWSPRIDLALATCFGDKPVGVSPDSESIQRSKKAELFEFYHSLSTYGSYILVAGFLLIAFYLVKSLFNGKVAGSNPWGALTMEWDIPSPAPPHNFLEEPKFTHGPYAYDKVIKEKTVGDK